MITNEAERHIKKLSFWKYYWKNTWHLQGFLVAAIAVLLIIQSEDPNIWNLRFIVGCMTLNSIIFGITYFNWRKK